MVEQDAADDVGIVDVHLAAVGLEVEFQRARWLRLRLRRLLLFGIENLASKIIEMICAAVEIGRHGNGTG